MSTLLKLDELASKVDRVSGPLVVPWPRPGKPDAFVEFSTLGEWKLFLDEFGLREDVHLPTRAKYHRAHKIYLLAWLDPDLIKAGELVALTALELALNDCYGTKVAARGKPKKPTLQSDTNPSGAASIQWFDEWARTRDPAVKARILDYNEDDCKATRVLLDGIRALAA